MGLRGDMKLQTASGPIRISELADKTVSDPDFSEIVFAWTGGRLFIDTASDFRVLGDEQIFEVELDDGSVLQVSASSQFVLKSGMRKMAPELVPGESLLPLYFDKDVYSYPTYQVPGKRSKRKISRLMAEWVLGRSLPKGTTVTHIDGIRGNYHPSNLKITIAENPPVKSHKHAVVKMYKLAESLFSECAAASPKMAKIVKPRRKTNHKVVRVTPSRIDAVYTASVRSMNSVSVSGVFLDLAS